MALECTCVFQHLYLIFIPLPHSNYTLRPIRQITIMLFFTRHLKDHVQMYCIQGYVGGEMLITRECKDIYCYCILLWKTVYCYGRQYSLQVHWDL